MAPATLKKKAHYGAGEQRDDYGQDPIGQAPIRRQAVYQTNKTDFVDL